MKKFIKKFIPRWMLLIYHKTLAIGANVLYRFPSKELIVIGVTGTNGKSTTCNLIAKVLEESEVKVGMMTTVNYKIADKEWLNSTRMTMLGRFQMQNMLRQMVSAGCRYVVVETSSEGIMQYRNWGIRYDVAVFTNLTPEHIEAHGSLQNYIMTKGKLFKSLSTFPTKTINGEPIQKTIIANVNDKKAEYFLSFEADSKYGYGLKFKENFAIPQFIGDKIELDVSGTKFSVQEFPVSTPFNPSSGRGETKVSMKLVGEFNVYNALAAITVGKNFGMSTQDCAVALSKVTLIPGRMELIDGGQNFTVLVDYAHDIKSFENLFRTLTMFKKNRIIHVFGSAGGVRDHAKRKPLGAFSAKHADITIVTDEDSYDEPIQKILDEIAAAAIEKGRELGKDLFMIKDRGEAIQKACELAREGDMVLITGKGTEQNIKSFKDYGKVIAWDDREAARKALKSLKS